MQRGFILLLLLVIAGAAYFMQVRTDDPSAERDQRGLGTDDLITDAASPAAGPATGSASYPAAHPTDPDTGPTPSSDHSATEARLARALETQSSGFMVEVRGRVERVLPDDEEGSRHQRFILRLESGQTLLVAHNIDLAARVPVHPGDPVEVLGQFEFSERGGTLHWTHHDPGGGRDGGWIEHAGIRYR